MNTNIRKIKNAELLILGTTIIWYLIFAFGGNEPIVNWLFNPHIQGGGWGLFILPLVWLFALLVIVFNFPAALKAILKNSMEQTAINCLIIFSPVVFLPIVLVLYL